MASNKSYVCGCYSDGLLDRKENLGAALPTVNISNYLYAAQVIQYPLSPVRESVECGMCADRNVLMSFLGVLLRTGSREACFHDDSFASHQRRLESVQRQLREFLA